ncbi:MAG TPA: HipA domain-containing protein [Limnobacter sp.]|uniref:type II toxin-antitoxin system HipA family toxin n=1 Tax=Limnobacter sp. TaxID=2003368 RepID=UPI002E329999|nr:HipA domain-containing protein [Limnobacter sp.]HEX5487468.1 HipA domain-containing protein [Limnobacter sp.]
MTSKQGRRAFVWVWLPGATKPVVAGVLTQSENNLLFNYGRSYLARAGAMPLYLPELPLQEGILPLAEGLSMPGCLRDAAPDAWGRRVIVNRLFGAKSRLSAGLDLTELDYLLESGSDRIGALDFQVSASTYTPRNVTHASLDELLKAAELVELGVPLSPPLELALHHGTAIGGARPKALIEGDGCKYIAKFSSSNDIYSVVKAEFVAMRLAAMAGLNAAPVSLVRAAGKDVLLVKRFDRQWSDAGWLRKPVVSALTILGLDEMQARYASYFDLAQIIRQRFSQPKATLKEVFGRLVFNVLCGNTDDHARNHAAFWDGQQLTLTPAYDICPQARTGQEASQAMAIHGRDNLSRLSTCLAAVAQFHLSISEGVEIIGAQLHTMATHWKAVCDEAKLSVVDRNRLLNGAFLNPFAFTALQTEAQGLTGLADKARSMMV